jgi:hypothetical protein
MGPTRAIAESLADELADRLVERLLGIPRWSPRWKRANARRRVDHNQRRANTVIELGEIEIQHEQRIAECMALRRHATVVKPPAVDRAVHSGGLFEALVRRIGALTTPSSWNP